MGPIAIDIDPVILQLGHFSLRWYGVATAVAMIVGFALVTHEAKRKGIPEDALRSMALWVIAAGVVGARLLHVIDNWGYYLANPWAVLAVQEGGLAIFGAILGGSAAGIFYARRRGLPLGRVADAAAPAAVLGQAIGRIACIINGDAVGAPTNLPWGFVYTNPGTLAPSLGQAYQPTQAYEMVWDLLVFGVLWWARDRLKVDGLLFLAYLMLYSVGKFVISFWRLEPIFLFGLREAQVVALGIIAFTIILAANLLSRARTQGLPGVSQ